MKKSTWRHFGYLEGLRKARNILRKQVKTISVFDQSKIDQAVYARIQMEKAKKYKISSPLVMVGL